MADAVHGTPRIISTCGSYQELIESLRVWFTQGMNVSYETIGALADLSPGYSNKLFAPRARVHAGSKTLDSLLTAAGLEVALIVNDAQLERVRRHHDFRERSPRAPYSKRHANAAVRTRKARRGLPFDSESGRIARARGLLLTRPAQRRKWARAAALARWGKPKKAARAPAITTTSACPNPLRPPV